MAQYDASLQAFVQECDRKGRPPQDIPTSQNPVKVVLCFPLFPKRCRTTHAIGQSTLMQAFVEGEAETFIAEWNALLSDEAKQGQSELQNMEFMTQVYFALYPLLNPEQSVNQFAQTQLKREE